MNCFYFFKVLILRCNVQGNLRADPKHIKLQGKSLLHFSKLLLKPLSAGHFSEVPDSKKLPAQFLYCFLLIVVICK